jgi:metal-sulfur cluster biosynthetic enzyme
MSAAEPLDERIRAALQDVKDPCSIYNGTNLSIFDLGMTRNIRVDDERVVIELMLDDPTCAYSGMISHEVHQVVDPIVEGREVELTMVVDEYWTEDRATPKARTRLEETRRIRREQLAKLRERRQQRRDQDRAGRIPKAPILTRHVIDHVKDPPPR